MQALEYIRVHPCDSIRGLSKPLPLRIFSHRDQDLPHGAPDPIQIDRWSRLRYAEIRCIVVATAEAVRLAIAAAGGPIERTIRRHSSVTSSPERGRCVSRARCQQASSPEALAFLEGHSPSPRLR